VTSTTPVLPPQVSPPEFATSARLPHEIGGVEVWAFPVLPGEGDQAVLLGPGADEAAGQLDTDLLAALESARATGRTGEVTAVPVLAGDVRLVLLVGVGAQTSDDFRRAGAALARATKDRASVATTITAIAPEGGLRAFVVGAMLGSFGFHWRSEGPKETPVARIALAGHREVEGLDSDLAKAIAVGGAGWRSRMLATVPANLKNPPWLADQAVEIAREAGLGVEVWDEQRLAAEGFGGIVGVGQASATPPRMIRLDYRPARGGRKARHVVLVGKGITFDTGGLDIKPAEGMVAMKRDMTGGGVVLATMAALAAVDCPVRVTGLIAAAENAVSGNSLRPGDVVRHYGGRTSEVTNTDAEGRLVMADALAYAVDRLAPDVLVDVATLTGAMKVALGQGTGGLFATDDVLAAAIEAAGRDSGERLWRFPLASEYEELLASKVADADNAAGNPGAITAALFLQHFTGGLPWAHLDVASVGDAPAEKHEWTAGPTGFGARVLLTWLGSADPLAGIA
jgi:leucyl aminopeptidase